MVSVFGDDLLGDLPESIRETLNEKWKNFQSSIEEENVAAKREEVEKGN